MRVAFIGKMGSGKTTATSILEGYGFTTKSFATPVKQIAANLMNNVLCYTVFHPDNDPATYDPPFYTVDRINKEKGHPTIRKLLQEIGTEIGREYTGYENIWVDHLVSSLENDQYIMVDDCRFPNEADALRSAGFKIIRIERRDAERMNYLYSRVLDANPYLTHDEISARVVEMTNHPSEQALVSYIPDAIILNYGTIEDLEKLIRKTLDIG